MNGTTTQNHPTNTSTAMTGFMPGPHCGRGTIDIVWSCLSTTILAIWVSLHQVVDSPHSPKVSLSTALRRLREKHIRVFIPYNKEWPLQWRKVFQATNALAIPEAIVTDSLSDLYAAFKLKDNLVTSGIKGFEKFSLRHAFFIVQQGVYFEDDDDNGVKLLTNGRLEKFARTGRLEFGDLPTDEQIADRSKSDRLLKSISVIQTLWFIANIIYRVCAGLQVSLLEDLTAAYAFCGFVMLAAWFRCPQDVCQPFIVQLRSESDTPPRVNPKRRDTSYWMRKKLLGYPLLHGIAFSLCAAVFTGIHVAAWKYSFASDTEKWLWRSCCLAMLPLLGVIFTCGRFGGSKTTLKVPFSFFLILYIISRLILISLAFTAFRKAPVGIYKDASWTDLIPHI